MMIGFDQLSVITLKAAPAKLDVAIPRKRPPSSSDGRGIRRLAANLKNNCRCFRWATALVLVLGFVTLLILGGQPQLIEDALHDRANSLVVLIDGSGILCAT